MGRPCGTKNIMRSAKEKEELILNYSNSRIGYRKFAVDNNIYPSIFHKWIMIYREKGIDGFKENIGQCNNKKLGKYNRHPSEEEKLKIKIIKLEIENARLKKGYQVKGVGAQKEFVTMFDVNIK
jgi:transposase-like protein